MTLRSKIPTANALFTFEAAAQTLNFTQAGQKLNVTQPAVSKSIALLEKALSTKLFRRERNQIVLTSAGEKLFRAVNLAFGSLEDVIDQISKNQENANALTLSVSTAFAAHWLIPQMDSFKQKFPDITLSFQLTAGEISGVVAPCDLGVRLETVMDTSENAIKFCPERLIALATPDYLEKNGRLDEFRQGRKHSIAILSGARISWETFLTETEQSIHGTPTDVIIPDYSVVLQTALNGRCAALGFISACGHLLKEGLLVPALPVSWQTDKSYYLVTPEPIQKNSAVFYLQEWMLQRNKVCMDFLDEVCVHQ